MLKELYKPKMDLKIVVMDLIEIVKDTQRNTLAYVDPKLQELLDEMLKWGTPKKT